MLSTEPLPLAPTPPGHPGPASAAKRGGTLRRRDIAALVAAGCLAFLLLAHGLIPERYGLRLIIESALPWLALPIVLLLALTAITRSRLGVLAAGLCSLVWLGVFGPNLLPLASPTAAVSASPDITVISQNLDASNTNPDQTVRDLLAAKPDVLVLEEFTGNLDAATMTALNAALPHTSQVGTVAVFSTRAIIDVEPLKLGLPWSRAFHGELQSDAGPISFYAIHADSVRPDQYTIRDTMLRQLSTVVAADPSPRIITVGDFNASSTDSSLHPLQRTLNEPRQTGGGLGFTWPAALPLTRPDHVFVKGLDATRMSVLDAPGSDHRGILATLAAG